MEESSNDRITRAIERALSEGPFTIQQLAAEAGVSYDTLYSWVKGRRVPRPENVRQLASGLSRRSDLLRELAGALNEAVESENR
ncbi:MAG TPA: helix-turn-helix transcriptional regulator [Longimicrobium sp.]|uniref:helix-turn-helix domain-containing protein n=1 Tax=Longimicrobium sp. TaxID=2029185 RepID=UPI002EDA8132